MEIIKTKIKDLLIIRKKTFKDSRGYFRELFKENVLSKKFVFEILSNSKKNVLRGLHLQKDNPQGKYVTVLNGKVFDVAVDLRKSSKSFGKWVGAKLSEKNKNLLWIPEGFGHGYIVMSKYATIHYQLTNFYDPKKEKSILWNDSEIGIKWPLKKNINPIVSKKDKIGKSLKNAKVYK